MLFLLLANSAYATFPPVVQKVQPLVIQQKKVQFDGRYYLGDNGYYAVENNLRAEKEEAKADDAAALREQNEILKQILAAITNGKPVPGTPVAPTPDEPAVEPVNTRDNEVLTLFKRACAKCHGDTKADGGLVLVKGGQLQFTGQTKEDYVARTNIYFRVNGPGLKEHSLAQMPKGGALTDDEALSVYLWMSEKVLE